MHMFGDLPGQAQGILVTSENVVRSRTWDDLELSALETAPSMSSSLAPQCPSEVPVAQVPEEGLGIQEPKCAPWLLGGMILMGLDSYFPQLSAGSSLWTPLQAAIPVLHWTVSWWILPPGWEPNLVSFFPSLTPAIPLLLGDLDSTTLELGSSWVLKEFQY
ncbi:hypothetical protein DSO57_1027138 [Entomophthora muscae]|uniref:Uncharacterized protein n=1 Tax=Entomophthora muscae TaxID=34485 RepID=A0ACC2RGJ4_9FUNG|nr:hypothetical protein DSO57_1027138 [Entomophthora muscae]